MGWQRAGRIMKEWLILLGLMVVLHGMLFAGWAILEPTLMRSRSLPTGLIVAFITGYVAALSAISILFSIRLGRAGTPPEYREARERGLPATATVLEIRETGWQSGRSRGQRMVIGFRPFSIRPRQTKYEYQMRLRVMRPGAAEYEATLAEYLHSDEAPQQGAAIAIKVHPQRPDVVVLA